MNSLRPIINCFSLFIRDCSVVESPYMEIYCNLVKFGKFQPAQLSLWSLREI
jgi:hypothetical protein